MKREARVLVSHCYSGVCLGLVLRGGDVDGAVAGRGCEELCGDAARRGYLGETRYYAGDCHCGLSSVPERLREAESLLLALSSSLPRWLEAYRRLARHLSF